MTELRIRKAVRMHPLLEIVAVFTRLGALGFGGPIALVAQMEEELSRGKKWVDPDRFSQTYALLKILPGPLSTQMAIFLGSVRGGRLGGWLAGFCFILPSFLMVLGLSILYAREGTVAKLPAGFMPGLQIGALAVIVTSTIGMFRPYQKHLRAWVIGAIAGAIIFLRPRWEPLVLLTIGLIGVFWAGRGSASSSRDGKSGAPARLHGFALAAVPGFFKKTLAQLFWVHFKAGAFVFGTGLAIVPVLEADVVGHHHWMTSSQFMDGLAIGQVTPGPVVITSTFVGYTAAGILGALVSTSAIFLPCFINVLYILPRIWKRVSGTKGAAAFTAFAIPAVIGGIFGTALRLAGQSVHGGVQFALLAVVTLLTWRFRPPAWMVIPASGLALGLISAGLHLG